MLRRATMKKSRVRNNFQLLEYLKSLRPSQQKSFIDGASRDVIYTLSELCDNLLAGNVSLQPKEITKLKKFQDEIRFVHRRKPSLKQKKHVLTRGGFLGAVLSVAIPALLSSILSSR